MIGLEVREVPQGSSGHEPDGLPLTASVRSDDLAAERVNNVAGIHS